MSVRSLKLSIAPASLIALALGLALGMTAHYTQNRALIALGSIVQPIGRLWLNLLRMMIVPLVVSMILVAVGSTRNTSWAGRLAGLSLAVIAGLMVLGVVVSLGLGAALMKAARVDRADISRDFAASAATRRALEAAPASLNGASWADRLVAIVPTNPVRAAADEELLPLLLITFLFGLAITRLEPGARRTALMFIRAIADTSMILLRWILRLLPVGVFALGFGMAVQIGPTVVQLIGKYILITSTTSVVVTMILYVIVVFAGGVPLGRAIRAFAPPQTLAVGSRSSLACLPLMIVGTEQHLGIAPEISRLVLPLAVSGFKLSMTISASIDLLFFSQVFGVPIAGLQLAGLIALMCIGSAAFPAVAGGAPLGVDVAVFLALGFPLETIVIREAGDTINDIFLTVLNVTANMTTTAVIARSVAPMIGPALGFERQPAAAGVATP